MKKLNEINVIVISPDDKTTPWMAARYPNTLYINVGSLIPYIIRCKQSPHKNVIARQIIDLMKPVMNGVYHETAHLADPWIDSMIASYRFKHNDLIGRTLNCFAYCKVEAGAVLRENAGKSILVNASSIKKFAQEMNAATSMIIDRRRYTLNFANMFILSNEEAFLVDLEKHYKTPKKSKIHPIGLHMATTIALENLRWVAREEDVWLYEENVENQADIRHFGKYLKEKDTFFISTIPTDCLRSAVVKINNSMDLYEFIKSYNESCDFLGIEPAHRIITFPRYRQLQDLRTSLQTRNPRSK